MWQTKYDSILNQVYYQNTEDGSVSFDLPCEVQNSQHPKKSCDVVRPNFLSRITSKLLLHRSRSPENRSEMAKKSIQPVAAEQKMVDAPVKMDASVYFTSMPLSLEDSYMLENPLNLYNSDVESVSSCESIQSFYLELAPNEIYYDYENSIYYDEKALQYIEEDYDKEKERYELRLQIMKELY
ncbi:CIC11C00000004260 [Sungouiella intermedia]|uniref:CIC11C00000004260 n=1 Tax=Sungouiella intermedia TaxID=45354 RepID=A0A1L0DNJ0_9ASCO|nr:CIC11C00000004260 [[Candida] intermedia]